jgi:hypothetical protein
MEMEIYWKSLFIFSSISIGITGLFIWMIFSRKKILHALMSGGRRNNMYMAFGPSKSKGNFTVVERTRASLVVAFLTMITVLALYMGFPYWLDLPRAVTSNYAVTQGTVNDYEKVTMKGREWGYTYSILIDNTRYHSMESNLLSLGETVTITFLPHTKVIIDIK